MSSYYTGNGIGFRHLGDTPAGTPTGDDGGRAAFVAQATTDAERLARMEQWDREHPNPWNPNSTSLLTKLAAIGGTLSMPVLAYHGFRRNSDSVGWALVWGFFGSWVWPITVPIALAQGFAKRRVAPNRRRRSSRRRRTSRSRSR